MSDEKKPWYPVDGSDSKSPEECVQLYEKWSDTYDSDTALEKYYGPELLLEICLQFLPNKNAKILDFLCGTGKVGKLLAEKGYTNIEGIDGAQKMIEKCQLINIYRRLMVEILHPGQPSNTMEAGSYDALVAVGIFAPGHLGPDCLNHLFQPVKKGGLIIFGIREPWLEELDLTEKLKHLESTGVWRLIERVKKADYRGNVPGAFFVFQRL